MQKIKTIQINRPLQIGDKVVWNKNSPVVFNRDWGIGTLIRNDFDDFIFKWTKNSYVGWCNINYLLLLSNNDENLKCRKK
jgi:hypothetical protein